MASSSPPDEFSPPFIQIDGLDNFRDIGSWPTTTPHVSVRQNVLYRGPDLGPITPKGEQELRDLGIETIFDIRSVPQIERAGGVQEVEGIKRVWCPVFEESEYTLDKAGLRYTQYASDGTDGIVEAFEEILRHGAKTTMKPLLEHLASLPTEGKIPAAMIHCTTGNNRSGVFIGVLLALLGVDDEVVAEEYSLSQVGLQRGRDMVVDRLMRNPKFREALGEGEEGRKRAERMVGARVESMRDMLKMVQRRWGGVEGYVREEVGLGDEVIQGLRRVMRVTGE
ncbi:(Phosphotyrosine protein) phosphatases II [Glarea lozoyensis ATCC 20868]|uniref:(Phosphotyrosine protein) phosphatases II n=2 Tax=Glarea lozoyensis TaxID=101852 RepID=S3D5L3_GLAL2|nr:(Phosphotyrosine protein) phosphatases II [Glarea lozoyensis ATCC 20868]EHL00335.1 putative Tyrosine-protein phosphatase [Glarea lozoyensis 74030]EPE27371.1 (Phosphotyrosine protein) phosphatases II [Glarea lozoyensis ATCC 20868]